ncbi:uncharacterized protein N7483_003420 [Penicillium malachiteum]|uniref:uncharacterized protein n=1 Tax=Penicillium malachiteum TaxID=1324776 RepID=UPI002549B9E9|nr:uncharacterized protein N7483_003420 [Penicillium malachiteum]KAJ5728912.1 hypothetical protein N7483_003420 [Penicillium malachiteum]
MSVDRSIQRDLWELFHLYFNDEFLPAAELVIRNAYRSLPEDKNRKRRSDDNDKEESPVKKSKPDTGTSAVRETNIQNS